MLDPLAAFRDPVRRPRAIILLGTTLLVIFALYGVSMMLTSTQWFCNDACHNVHADNEKTFYAGSHSQVSCMACHYRPNMDPARFAIDRIDKLLDVYPTIAGTFEMPLNEHSRLALRTADAHCTQCHGRNRDVTPSPGMLIDHEAHRARGVACTICHNRIAHNEDFELQLKDPKTGEPNKKHAVFTSMTACFRCHGLETGSPAPGECAACHTPGFELKPPSHLASDFFPKKHAELAKEAYDQTLLAIEISERFKIPVLLRMTTRVAGSVHRCSKSTSTCSPSISPRGNGLVTKNPRPTSSTAYAASGSSARMTRSAGPGSNVTMSVTSYPCRAAGSIRTVTAPLEHTAGPSTRPRPRAIGAAEMTDRPGSKNNMQLLIRHDLVSYDVEIRFLPAVCNSR